MNIKCLFGHLWGIETLDQPNKKVIKRRIACLRCGKEQGVLTWPNPRFAEEECRVPPPGWYCTRTPGHDGPCAALPNE
jgi:hypothetical protein